MLTSIGNKNWWLESSALPWCHSNCQELLREHNFEGLGRPLSLCSHIYTGIQVQRTSPTLSGSLTSKDCAVCCILKRKYIHTDHSGYSLNCSKYILQTYSIEIIVIIQLKWIQSYWRFGGQRRGDERGGYERIIERYIWSQYILCMYSHGITNPFPLHNKCKLIENVK